MKCAEVRDAFVNYWDLAEDDAVRQAIDSHLLECEHCAEQLLAFEEIDASLLGEFSLSSAEIGELEHVNREVMSRIYAEQSWLLPVTQRNYTFSRTFRRNLAAFLACCMAIFVCAFVYLLVDGKQPDSSQQLANLTGLIDTASASDGISTISAEFYKEVPVASISDPIILSGVPTVPQYWVALSMMGIIMTLLILSWFTRTRS